MVSGTYTSESAGDLNLEKILKAKKEYEDSVKKLDEEIIYYYKTSNEINEVDKDGKPYCYYIKKENLLIFHPNNLPKVEKFFKDENLILKRIEEKLKKGVNL